MVSGLTDEGVCLDGNSLTIEDVVAVGPVRRACAPFER